MNKVKKYFLISIILLILSVLYTIAVKNVDTAKRNLTDSLNLYRTNEEKTKGTVENLSTEGIF